MTAKADRDIPMPPLPAYFEDDGGFTCEGRAANTVRELCQQMLAASFPPSLGLIVRDRDQQIIQLVESIGTAADQESQ